MLEHILRHSSAVCYAIDRTLILIEHQKATFFVKWLLCHVGYLHTKLVGWSMSLPFNNFSVSPSCKTPNPTNYPKNMHPHELCLGCSTPYRSSGDCPHWGQFSNFSYGQLNGNLFGQGFESHYNSYTPNWDNHSNVSWYAHATGNYALQSNELHHPDYS